MFVGGAALAITSELLFIGWSKIAQGIMHLTLTYKIKKKLARKYRDTLDKFDSSYDSNLKHESSNKIWICWFQGIENAPLLVKQCYKSVVKNNPDKEVVIIDLNNMSDYVHFPDYILEKWEKGIIPNAQMSDMLRIELLINHGGTWMDSTVFCSGGEIPYYFFKSDLFFYQSMKHAGHSTYLSSWYINAKTNNKILMATRALLYEYWKEHNWLCDYFIFHDFFSIALDRYQKEWKAVIPRDNSTPHIFQRRMFDQYDERIWDAVRQQTPFHKLTYKYDANNPRLIGSFLDTIVLSADD